MALDSFAVTTQPEWGEFASQLVSLFAITTIACLFAVKTFNVEYRHLAYARWLVILLYICSWTFTASTTILASTNNGNYTSCFLSIMACDVFYCGTKVCIYLWLIERAYIADDKRKTRFDSWSYRFHLFLLTPFIAIFCLMIIYHNSIMTSTGECFIGLQPIANIPVLVYDTIFNLYMTILFVIPLIRVGKRVNKNEWKSSWLYNLTKRSLIASSVSLVASFANALGATIMHGKQRGYLCLMCCTIDVTINVLTIHWVTTSSKSKHRGHDTSGLDHISSCSTAAAGATAGAGASSSNRKNTVCSTLIASTSSSSPPPLLAAAPVLHNQQHHSTPSSSSSSSTSLCYQHQLNHSTIPMSNDSQHSAASLTNSPII